MSPHGAVSGAGVHGAGDGVQDDAATPPLAMHVRRGTPTAEELAAVIAVVTEAYAQESADAVGEDAPRDAWALAGRGLRGPLRRELGWRGFGG